MKKATYRCIYCQEGRVNKLPAKCPVCRRSLKLEVKPSTKLSALVERYFENGLRLNVKTVPGKGGIAFRRAPEK